MNKLFTLVSSVLALKKAIEVGLLTQIEIPNQNFLQNPNVEILTKGNHQIFGFTSQESYAQRYNREPYWLPLGPSLFRIDGIYGLFTTRFVESSNTSAPLRVTVYVMKQDADRFNAVWAKYSEIKHSETLLFEHDAFSKWKSTPLKTRPLSSIVLTLGLKEKIIDSIDRFFASEQWYRDRGIPHRLGIVFAGPPGTGKSSFIRAIAGHYNLHVYNVVFRKHVYQSTTGTETKIEGWPEPNEYAFVSVEDLDRDESILQHGLGYILNCLDGFDAKDGQVTIITVNDKSKLPPALIRPGRIDHIFDFSLLTEDMAIELARSWGYEALAPTLVGLSPAQGELILRTTIESDRDVEDSDRKQKTKGSVGRDNEI